jgi:hypothetical protein
MRGHDVAVNTVSDLNRWLLAGDPAIRWQVLRDLLDKPTKVVELERARVATEGWGARLLVEQSDDGTWGGGLYHPKWVSTTYTLLLLRQLGLPRGHPAAQRACLRLLEGAQWYQGGLIFSRTVRVPETCITAMVVSFAVVFDAVDHRVEGAMEWLLGNQLQDGGWNCQAVRSGSRHGSFDSTISALEALEAWLEARGPDDVVNRAADEGREFLLDHQLYRSHRTGAVVEPRYTRPTFPTGWHYDILRGLDHFRRSASSPDPRLDDAIDLLRTRREPDGSWRMYAHHPGRYWFELEPAGAPSRLNTLRALRVLRWWDADGDHHSFDQ